MAPRTYLITASTGIGAETARMLARQGHAIFVLSRTEANCVALAEELQALGADAAYYAGDVAKPATAVEAIKACTAQFGRLDGLYNVAGISGRKFGDGPLHECTEEGWQTVIETNLSSQYRMCREALNVMRAQAPHTENGQRGVILNMASILGIHPEPKNFSAIAYAAGKGGIIAMSRSAAAYYAKDKIRLNVIAPALVQTPMSARASENPEIVEFIESKQPLTGGMVPCADAAAVSKFLLSDDSRAMTGEVIEVDGGWNLV
jgi:NAD(P)-dependent dehydrogenase (short-subunit alcohol dehydrogenase family)